jgi:hypothetical protein
MQFSFADEKNGTILGWVLLLAAMHSLSTGVGLLLQPPWLLTWGGWRVPVEPFFPAQGGVFHILMALLYLYAASSRIRMHILLPFIVTVKATATVFLAVYVFAVQWIWMVAASAVFDGLLAVVLFLLSSMPRHAPAEEVI